MFTVHSSPAFKGSVHTFKPQVSACSFSEDLWPISVISLMVAYPEGHKLQIIVNREEKQGMNMGSMATVKPFEILPDLSVSI